MYYAVVDELPFSECTAAADTLAAGFVDEDEEVFFQVAPAAVQTCSYCDYHMALMLCNQKYVQAYVTM